MRIGIIGTGAMAEGLGGQWARAGHDVLVGGRDERRTAELAARIGARAGDPGQAALRDVVLLAVPYAAAVPVVSALADALAGRTLIDCTNPVGPGFRLETGGGPSAAERIAAAAPGVRVVKAFNLCHESVWRLTPPVFDDRPLAVPLCGDDPAALESVRRLVRDLGCEPVNGGGLDRAALLEATAAFLIGLWVGEGADAQAIAPPLRHAGV
ncbi:NADPH-dependent F420 reductase [Streptomyces davaonensis JCM 4913]|uniref:NADPH-dependent F420 reductase n=1 Tax=Streptomyces davaonensis (strain DSM 101723 / JCM 4913 / KCC S-0913 / 768) TaxID=1214101 RepID=K4QZZ4_STRDJ|nr:NAD(P)-binding domain-containing protein [Streptomyces davaonensis]CCK29616.1 NADPH-dependent F420 reductase [Streptomyces davaonensis JCM 4913]